MDLSRGYGHIPLASKALENPFSFSFLLFGIKNAPATFQWVNNEGLEGLKAFAVAYLNDTALFSPSYEENLVQMSHALDKLAADISTYKSSECQA